MSESDSESNAKQAVYVYVKADGSAQGKLKHGLNVGGGKKVFDFVMNPVATAQQMFDCEQEAGVDTPLSFNAALMAKQLKSIDNYQGPFTMSLIGTISPADYSILRAAQMELSEAGN